MRLILKILIIGGIVVQTMISCSPDNEEEASPSSSSAAKTVNSSSSRTSSPSSSSLDCSVVSSSSASENLCLDFDPDAEVEHHGKKKKQFCDERNGKKYAYVQIGEQIWMAENLNYAICGSKCGRIGETVYSARFLEDANTENCDKYGRLYDWNMALTICPDGWHLPSDAEWTALADYAGGDSIAGTKLKAVGGDWACKYSSLYSKTKLLKPMDDLIMHTTFDCYDRIEGTDDYGFSALPGGCGSGDTGYFYGVGERGLWWSAAEYQGHAYGWVIDYYQSDIRKFYDWRTSVFSVRCVKDPS